MFWILVGCAVFALPMQVIMMIFPEHSKDRVATNSSNQKKTIVVSEKGVGTNRQRKETPRAQEKPAEPVRTRKMRKVKRNSVELFPIEETKVFKDPSSSLWLLVGEVRNNADHPVKGFVRIRFVNKTGYVFHNTGNIVVGRKAMTAIQLGEIPLLPQPEWIRPGDSGWFVHPEEPVVFEEAANIEVTFEKVSN